MKTLNEVKVGDFEISLSKLNGQPIKDVLGYISMEFGEPTFQLTKIIMEDGSDYCCEGEHDMPYLTDGYGETEAKFDNDELSSIYEESNS